MLGIKDTKSQKRAAKPAKGLERPAKKEAKKTNPAKVTAKLKPQGHRESKGDVGSEQSYRFQGKLGSGILTYSVEEDNEYLTLIEESVKTGMPPMITQDSSYMPMDLSDIIDSAMKKNDSVPLDFSMTGGSKPKSSGDVEVSIL